MAAEGAIDVEVVYALPDEQRVVKLEVARGTTAGEAVRLSGLLEPYPGIDPATARIGLHGRVVTGDAVLNAGDRVEIYRSLIADPKQARRRRAMPRR
jgi:putative ubiquitin-RnfH superfamily antitoxin RatB of RatAB toxin-antitoxin module